MRQVAKVVNYIASVGKTVVIVTHDPEFILRCCNYILHFEHGRIQERYSIDSTDGRNRLLEFFRDGMEQSVSQTETTSVPNASNADIPEEPDRTCFLKNSGEFTLIHITNLHCDLGYGKFCFDK